MAASTPKIYQIKDQSIFVVFEFFLSFLDGINVLFDKKKNIIKKC